MVYVLAFQIEDLDADLEYRTEKEEEILKIASSIFEDYGIEYDYDSIYVQEIIYDRVVRKAILIKSDMVLRWIRVISSEEATKILKEIKEGR